MKNKSREIGRIVRSKTSQFPSVKISDALKDELDKLKIHPYEPYFMVIKRIIDYYNNHEKLKGNGTKDETN